MAEHLATLTIPFGGSDHEARLYDTDDGYIWRVITKGMQQRFLAAALAVWQDQNAFVVEFYGGGPSYGGAIQFSDGRTYAELEEAYPMPVPMGPPLEKVYSSVMAQTMKGRVTWVLERPMTWLDDPPGRIY